MKAFLFAVFVFGICLVQGWPFFSDTLIFRSEFEQVGDEIARLPICDDTSWFRPPSGNDSGYYDLDLWGKLTIKKTIPDVFGTVHVDSLYVNNGCSMHWVVIVDAYDYFIQTNPQYQVLDEHLQTQYSEGNPYTAYNNLWGKGSALPNVDFRMATLVLPNLPDSTVFLWDVPSTPADYSGSSVWSYISVVWGNRTGMRSDVSGFPFTMNSLGTLRLNFDYEQLFGTQDYKVALNQFFTEEDSLVAFSKNVGDFFMVFDQIGTWVPPYPTDIGDTLLDGHTFARLYKEDAGYEWRRVIIKNEDLWTKGSLDLVSLYNNFADRGYIQKHQSVPNIQLGLEITNGFGAVRLNHLDFNTGDSVPTQLKVRIENQSQEQRGLVFDLFGKRIFSGSIAQFMNQGVKSGSYFVKRKKGVERVMIP